MIQLEVLQTKMQSCSHTARTRTVRLYYFNQEILLKKEKNTVMIKMSRIS